MAHNATLWDPAHEDRKWLSSLRAFPHVWRGFGRPAEVSAIPWHRKENQGRLGSCQGNAQSSGVERIVYVATRKAVQLSRIYAYLRTQEMDGLIGRDVGSSISSGGKCALEGLPVEELTGYPDAYPDRNAINRILAAKAQATFRAHSTWAMPTDPELGYDAIGGGAAGLWGIRWYNGIIPRDRIIRSYKPGRTRSGHALAELGYRKDGLFEWWNSHDDGVLWVTPEARDQMLADSYTASIVLMGQPDARPDLNWAEEGYL